MSEATGGLDPARHRADAQLPPQAGWGEDLGGAAAAPTGDGDVGVRWQAVIDGVMRGITHAFSNRVATLGAAAYMLEHGDLDAQEGATSLREEAERLDALVQLLRQLPSRCRPPTRSRRRSRCTRTTSSCATWHARWPARPTHRPCSRRRIPSCMRCCWRSRA